MSQPAAKYLALLAALTLTAASPKPAPVDVTDFSVVNLQNGAILSIDYDTQGCFSGASRSLLLSSDSVTYQDETRPLTLKQAQDLDTYLRQLGNAQGQVGGCTTSARLKLTVVRDTDVRTVSLYDDFCGHFPGGRSQGSSPDHLRFDLFENPQTAQMTPLPE